ncbi:Serine/threonine kinase [Actinomortierella ambigua]|uniref:protein kinase C n=1 Tax=Actinomortierella ambigua TaxID=1343610 RepID=A0A9P6QLZ8_9FUNG|nr:Serine/threonine kinase [Actinomortierella ambigua]
MESDRRASNPQPFMDEDDRKLDDLRRRLEKEKEIKAATMKLRDFQQSPAARAQCDATMEETQQRIDYFQNEFDRLQLKKQESSPKAFRTQIPITLPTLEKSPMVPNAMDKHAPPRSRSPSGTLEHPAGRDLLQRPLSTVDLLKAPTPITTKKVTYKLRELAYKLDVEKKVKQGQDKLEALGMTAKENGVENAEKILLLKRALQKYQSLYLPGQDDDQPSVSGTALRRPMTGKLHIRIAGLKNQNNAPTRSGRAPETTAYIKVDSQLKAKTRPARAGSQGIRWNEEFEIPVEKGSEIEILVCDRPDHIPVPIGMFWLKISDLVEDLRRKKVEADNDAAWIAANGQDIGSRAPPSIRPTTGPLGDNPVNGVEGIESWWDLEPVGQISLKFNFIKDAPIRKRPSGLGRQGAVRKRKEDVLEIQGHKFVTQKFYQIMCCALCAELFTGTASQCEDCSFTCHQKCAEKVFIKCISSKTKEDADEAKLNHRIPHRFETYTNLSPTWCCHCGHFLAIGRRHKKCSECPAAAHESCADLVPDHCGMSPETANKLMEEIRRRNQNQRVQGPKTPAKSQSSDAVPQEVRPPMSQRPSNQSTSSLPMYSQHSPSPTIEARPVDPQAQQRLQEQQLYQQQEMIRRQEVERQQLEAHEKVQQQELLQRQAEQQRLQEQYQQQQLLQQQQRQYEQQQIAQQQELQIQQMRLQQIQLQQQQQQQQQQQLLQQQQQQQQLEMERLRRAQEQARLEQQKNQQAQQFHDQDMFRREQARLEQLRLEQEKHQQRIPPITPLMEQRPLVMPPVQPPSLKIVDKQSNKAASKVRYGMDDFHFIAVLGKGNFGKVMLAEDKKNGELFAIKALKKESIVKQDEIESARSEKRIFQVATKERHPFLTTMHACFQTDTRLYFVMEYVRGGDLMMHIQRDRRFGEQRAKFYGCEVLLALQYFHQNNIVYRDLKLDNIMLAMDGHIKIGDYGLCKENMGYGQTTNTICGTPEFMAPEILEEQPYDRAVDWWAFGVLMYEMLLGRAPFSGEEEDDIYDSILEDEPWFPQGFGRHEQALLQSLLVKVPSQRLGSGPTDADEIKAHAYFRNVNFDDVYHKRIRPPFLPTIKSRTDISNFDTEFTSEAPGETPSDYRLNHVEQNMFQGFSYVAPWIEK